MRLARQTPRATEIPRGFLDFCRWGDVTLTPGQAELARVGFDGAEPLDRDLAATLFGPDLQVGTRSVVAAVCGARAGKSYVLVALRLVWGMLMRDVSAIPPGQRAVALIIAPRDDLRMEVFRYALGFVQHKPELAAMLDGNPRVDEFTLRRPDGARVSFETGVATMGGTAARGRWFTDFALDECAFFRDSTFKVNDEELFRAGSSRVLPGGQTIVASTPWAEGGLLHRLWKTKPADTLVAHAPTLVLNDSDLTRAIVARATESDPDNAKREFGAVFMTSGTTVFFESSTVEAAVTQEYFELQPGDVVSAGVDLGLISDSAALMLVALRGDGLHLFDGREERPQDGRALRPTETVEGFTAVIVGRCEYVTADSHYRESLSEALEKHALVVSPAPVAPAPTYVRTRMLLRDLRIHIHAPNLAPELLSRLLQQMREVQGRPTSGGGMSIIHPRWAQGGHGDLVSALVLALWQVSGDAVQAKAPDFGTLEWEAAQKEFRRKRHNEAKDKPRWMPANIADRGDNARWRR